MSEGPGRINPSDTPAVARPSTLRFIFFNERELRAGWRLLVYIALAVLFLLGLQLAASRLHLPLPTSQMKPVGMLVGELLSLAAAFGAAAIMGVFEHRTIGVYGLPAREAFRSRFWQGVVWGLVMVTAIILLIAAGGGYSFGRIPLNSGAIFRYAALWGLVFLTVGFFEEFLFRGYTQFTLATGIGFWPAAIVLSVGFGGAHLMNPGEGWVGALGVVTIAMFFCLTLRRTGSLWFAVGLHAAFDWGETFLYSVPNSGIVAPGHLSNSSLHGARWLTGGTVGPEGSVMAFAVMAAAFVVFAYVYPQPPTPAGSGSADQSVAS
ncbi:MAG: CPBP family intramembrane metalloprotease [Acidobacteriota bacterium]|nr:CPBP family intramembrane metalloprotease [Acidobacteriota bacterium]